MSATIKVLKQLFVVLCRIQKSAWIDMNPEWGISEQVFRTCHLLFSHPWLPIREKEIERLFSESGGVELNLSDRNEVLYLPPMKEEPDFLPVLSLECKLDDDAEIMKLRLMLVHCSGDEGKPHGIGFRMEAGENIHGFYHAQLIRNLEGAAQIENPPTECPLRFPETQPCIPLKVQDTVTLILCLLISLYGIKYCWALVADYQLSELTNYLRYFGVPN